MSLDNFDFTPDNYSLLLRVFHQAIGHVVADLDQEVVSSRSTGWFLARLDEVLLEESNRLGPDSGFARLLKLELNALIAYSRSYGFRGPFEDFDIN